MKALHKTAGAAFAAFAFLSAAAPAAGQDTRYQQWQDPAKPDRTQQLIDKLTPLIDDAERLRAADPRFLSDLRAALRDFDRPWKLSLWRDDFSDGDYTRNPAWRLAAGQFWVEQNFGLRSAIAAQPAPAAEPEPQPQRKLTREEKASRLFGAILGQALGGNQSQGQAGAGAGAAPEPDTAAIEAPLAISNAFSARVELSSWASPGQAEFAVLQGGGADGGYSLVYAAGTQPTLALQRVSARGRATIDSVVVAALEDRKLHRLEWNRAADGTMTVLLDDQPKIRTLDRTYRGTFDRFQIVNRGGDYILRSVEILGSK